MFSTCHPKDDFRRLSGRDSLRSVKTKPHTRGLWGKASETPNVEIQKLTEFALSSFEKSWIVVASLRLVLFAVVFLVEIL